jgi:hypothetical protein
MPKPIAAPSLDPQPTEAATDASLRFSDAQWQSILQALSAGQRGRVSLWPLTDPSVKRSLEQIAAALHRIFRSAKFKELVRPLSKKEKQSYRAIAKATRKLVSELKKHPRLVASVFPENIFQADREQAWDRFKSDLIAVGRCADHDASHKHHPPNIDSARNLAWAQVATVYEQVTGGRKIAAADVKRRDGSRVPDGPFVRLIQAFMAAIPGEIEPAGHAVQHWFRAYWKKAGHRQNRPTG